MRVLVVAVSARMLASLAVTDGYEVVALDRFGDFDLRAIASGAAAPSSVGLVSLAAEIEADAQRFTILGIDADRWSSDPVLQEIGYRTYINDVMAYTNDFTHMSDPMHRLFELVVEKKLRHHGNPVARWCFDCCEARLHTSDPDLVMPAKIKRDQSSNRIDAVPSGIMAVNAWWTRGHEVDSVYNTESLLIV